MARSQPSLFDPPAEVIREGIAADLQKPFTRYEPGEDVCASRHKGAETSEAAHERGRGGHEATRLQILEYVRGRGQLGATCEEISEALELRYTTASARCSELLAAGDVVRIGATRPTSSGSPASVVVAKELA